MTIIRVGAALLFGLLANASPAFAADDLKGEITWNPEMGGQYTAFSNQGSILNTRHNLMQSTLGPQAISGYDGNGDPIPTPGGGGRLTAEGGAKMNGYRNDYGEVCVYCHTPHGANTNAAAPLWNRVLPTSPSYQTYNQLGTVTINQSYSQPGGASLPCLSCHDGTQAVDAIINMPGSGRYNATPSNAGGTTGDLYTRWTGAKDVQRSTGHLTLSEGTSGCLSCHANPGNNNYSAVDFTVFAIGTDLRNDHPVGVTFPAVNGTGTDWNTPAGVKTTGRSTGAPNDLWTTLYFEEGTADGKMQKNEIRLYATGEGPEVECASCHDPHGVPGSGGKFNKTFLRKNNTGSAVCLTCHAK